MRDYIPLKAFKLRMTKVKWIITETKFSVSLLPANARNFSIFVFETSASGRDRAFVSVQTRFSTAQSHGRIDRICGDSNSSNSSSSRSVSNSSIHRLYMAASSRRTEPGLHTAWPRLTGFCAEKFALNDARESVHARVNARFQPTRMGVLYVRPGMRATSPGCTSARVNARPNRMVENYA